MTGLSTHVSHRSKTTGSHSLSRIGRRSLLRGTATSLAVLALGNGLARAEPDEVSAPTGMVLEPEPVEAASPAELDVADLGFSRLVEEARALAGKPFASRSGNLPAALAELNYDGYRAIRFIKARSPWADQGDFALDLFHLGGFNRTPVRILEEHQGRATPLSYDPTLFDFGDLDLPDSVLADVPGFAGLRIRAALNDPKVLDDLIVFQGASYFRALGAGSRYGASARGIAVDTALAKGEEFPSFTLLQPRRPVPGADRVTVLALLDGPSLTGAYSFTVFPGDPTRVSVDSHLFIREDIAQLGVAPLTSMFDFGPIDRVGIDDFRPRVHDSEGLAMHTGGDEWLWRPLHNPDRLEVNLFMDRDPRGFGLIQRTRGLEAYQDLEARYDLRPTLWVVPKGDWGLGSVRLVEIPTPDETNDNIVAFWTPDKPVLAGQALRFSYDLVSGLEQIHVPLARVVASRAGHYGVPGTDQHQEVGRLGRKWVIEFVGGPLDSLVDTSGLEVEASAGASDMAPPVLVSNPATGGVRVYLDLVSRDEGPVNIRVFLTLEGQRVSETWTFQWRAPVKG
ncbi:MAG: glucan biosynthesis protein [Rhodospirillum sp.]|nr:glucan biosynthesis protein [Rhodospirillum sp.]MCF8489660.1 glucan biosynthesis protein [Rhodospirillum sp.]MCF8502941.1 glucan biosynthesis protein [Rhodospirillum sp.]